MFVLYLSIWRGEVVIETALQRALREAGKCSRVFLRVRSPVKYVCITLHRLQFAPSPWTDFLCALSDSMTPNLASLVYHMFLFMVWVFSLSLSPPVCVCVCVL